MATTPMSALHKGWHNDPDNSRVQAAYNGTAKFDLDATGHINVPAGTLNVEDGGAVTQITNRSTGVTLNTHSGVITTDNTSLAAGAEATFTVTNSTVAATDVVVVSMATITTGTPVALVTDVSAGSFDITISNLNGSTADTSADVINFVVIKGANS